MPNRIDYPTPAPRTQKDLRQRLRDDIIDAAQALLGAELVHGELRARIVETEAYRGEDDPGCHAYQKITPRTKIMYEGPGLAYVYFTYGNHWMLNITGHEPGRAAAVLIRAAEPLSGMDAMRLRRLKARNERDLLAGPGKICAAFEINGHHNGLDLLDPKSPLRIEVGRQPAHILVGTRIGLAPGKGDELAWRYIDADALPWASRPHPK